MRDGAYGDGSSPHPWGRLAHPDKKHEHTRFIPTSVGQTLPYPTRITLISGSSPHPWGRHLPGLLHRLFPRFIPTSVGQTIRAASMIRTAAVHPHIRGADNVKPSLRSCLLGSSPHPWGRPRMLKRRVNRAAVHPHIRGADQTRHYLNQSVPGSSPHPWGRQEATRLDGTIDRFIPTSVGQTSDG